MGIEPDRIFTGLPVRAVSMELRNFNPTSIVTGTQVQDRKHPITFEQIIWGMAARKKVNTVAVLDNWAIYTERFSDMKLDAELRTVEVPLNRLPAKIAVMDDYAKYRMFKLGFPESMVKVTGNPYFEYLLESFARLSSATKQQMLAKPVFSGFNKMGDIVTFMSHATDIYPDIGFTEASVLRSFLKVIDNVAAATGTPINVIVRPHPFRSQNTKEAFDCDTPHLVKVLHNPVTAEGKDPANDYSIEQLLFISDLVVGTFNGTLLAAKILGNKVINYLPGFNCSKYDCDDDYQKFLSDWGLSTRVTREEKLSEAIRAALEGRLEQKNMDIIRHGTDRIIELLV
jgi:hypothetical protein